MSVPALTVEVSHDGTTWVDISDHVSGRNGARVEFYRGRSRALGEWEPGLLTLELKNLDRAFDPMNENATFALRPGDYIRVGLGAVVSTVWAGWVDSLDMTLVNADPPLSWIKVTASDALARLQRMFVTSTALGQSGTALSSAHLTSTYSQVGFTDASTTSTGNVYCSNAGRNGAGNALAYAQQVVLTEGGNARYYAARSGSLTFRNRDWRPSTVIVAGGTGIPFADCTVDVTDDEWCNYVQVTPETHTDSFTSLSSVVHGTGSKTFSITPSTTIDPVTVGATAVASSTAGAAGTLTGTVTAYSSGSITINVTSTSGGSGTGTAWSIQTTEPATAQDAYDTQSYAEFNQWRRRELSTLHVNRTVAGNFARVYAAGNAWPDRRLSSVQFQLAGLSSADQTTLYEADIHQAMTATLDLEVGSPSTIKQTRMIDGVHHQIEQGSHLVTFTLGRVPSMDFTATLKQNGSTVASTTNLAVYKVEDGWCKGHGKLTASAAGTNNTEVKVTASGVPQPASSANDAVGIFYYGDASAGWHVGAVLWNGTDFQFIIHSGSSFPFLGQSPAYAVASGDVINFSFQFLVA